MSGTLRPSTRLRSLLSWFDSQAAPTAGDGDRIDWIRVIPFVAMHLMCVGVLWVGISPVAVAAAVLMYVLRMFAITGFYHRYFSHRSFQTSRPLQLLFACLGSTAAQRGPLWWASHHRDHHRFSDQAKDAHSPRQRGFWWSHLGWFLSRANFPTRWRNVPDLSGYPELHFLDRFDIFMPAVLAAALYGTGARLEQVAPELGTSAAQLLIWGFFVSTVALYHATFCINSLAHLIGRQRYATRDDSRNSAVLAALTLGEGWHNNHHRFPAASRQGIRWWEFDPTYLGLKVLSWFGLIWGLRPLPAGASRRTA